MKKIEAKFERSQSHTVRKRSYRTIHIKHLFVKVINIMHMNIYVHLNMCREN